MSNKSSIGKDEKAEIFKPLIDRISPFLIITAILIIFNTILGYVILNNGGTVFKQETYYPFFLLVLVYSYFLCGIGTFLVKGMIISSEMKARFCVMSFGIVFFFAGVFSELLVMPPEFWDLDVPFRESYLSQSIVTLLLGPFMSWLLGGFLITYFVYTSRFLNKKPIKRYNHLFVDYEKEKKIVTVEEETDITFQIHTKTALSLLNVELKRSDFFTVIKVFGDLPVDLPSKATYSKTFRILAEKVGNTKAVLQVKFISESQNISEFYEVSPLKIFIHSPPPDFSIEGILINVDPDNQFVLEQPTKLNIQITNIGKGKAKNVQVDLMRLKARGFKPFNEPKIVNSLSSSQNYIFDIQGIFLKSGKFKEQFAVRAKDLHGTEKSWVTMLPMVEIIKHLPFLQVTVSNPKTIQVGEIVRFQFEVTNAQKGRAKDLELQWKLPKESTVISGAKVIRIGDLSFNEKKKSELELRFTKEGNFDFECSLRGEDMEGMDLPLVKSKKLSVEVIQQAIITSEVVHHPISINRISDVGIGNSEFTKGTAFTVQKLMKRFESSEANVIVKVKENLKNKSLFVTRSKDVIKIESLEFNCQICMSSSSDKKFFQCRNCNRNVCWEHFKELASIGRSVCPHCDGMLVFLPRTCKKCLTDYLEVSKKEDYCDFCGYYLSYPPELSDLPKIIENLVKHGKKSLQSQSEIIDSKKDSTNN